MAFGLRYSRHARVTYADQIVSESDVIFRDAYEPTASERAAKRRRIEAHGEHYLRGGSLFLQSASLKGPLDGWVNPWSSSGYIVQANEATLGSDVREQRVAQVQAPPNQTKSRGQLMQDSQQRINTDDGAISQKRIARKTTREQEHSAVITSILPSKRPESKLTPSKRQSTKSAPRPREILTTTMTARRTRSKSSKALSRAPEIVCAAVEDDPTMTACLQAEQLGRDTTTVSVETEVKGGGDITHESENSSDEDDEDECAVTDIDMAVPTSPLSPIRDVEALREFGIHTMTDNGPGHDLMGIAASGLSFLASQECRQLFPDAAPTVDGYSSPARNVSNDNDANMQSSTQAIVDMKQANGSELQNAKVHTSFEAGLNMDEKGQLPENGVPQAARGSLTSSRYEQFEPAVTERNTSTIRSIYELPPTPDSERFLGRSSIHVTQQAHIPSLPERQDSQAYSTLSLESSSQLAGEHEAMESESSRSLATRLRLSDIRSPERKPLKTGFTSTRDKTHLIAMLDLPADEAISKINRASFKSWTVSKPRAQAENSKQRSMNCISFEEDPLSHQDSAPTPPPESPTIMSQHRANATRSCRKQPSMTAQAILQSSGPPAISFVPSVIHSSMAESCSNAATASHQMAQQMFPSLDRESRTVHMDVEVDAVLDNMVTFLNDS